MDTATPQTTTSARLVAPRSDNAVCCLCSTGDRSPTWKLNGYPVCSACAKAFATRRRIAFVADILFFSVLLHAFAMIIEHLEISVAPQRNGWLQPLGQVFFLLAFSLKDGFAGYSPGKRLLNLRVVDCHTLRPVGPWQSFLRNLPLTIPGIGILLAVISYEMLVEGPRYGDRFARTRVIWRQYADRDCFRPPVIHCRNCEYDLRHNTTGVCPGCGTPIPDTQRQHIIETGSRPAGNGDAASL